jgi:hypothetical protein
VTGRAAALTLAFALLLGAAGPAAPADRRWRSTDYAYNFIRTYIPRAARSATWGKGFLSLWGNLSFLETHLPAGLDGRRYVVAIRDLRTAIALYKKDMLYLVSEILGARRIDREILKVQILDISQQLQVIISTLQYVRRSLLKAAYYLRPVVRTDTLQKRLLRRPTTSTDNPWRGWFRMTTSTARSTWRGKGLDVVKVNLFLDY